MTDLSAVFSDVVPDEVHSDVPAVLERVLLNPFVPDPMRDAWVDDSDDEYEARP